MKQDWKNERRTKILQGKFGEVVVGMRAMKVEIIKLRKEPKIWRER